MVCHLFEDTKEETTSTEEPEEPELQFGFIEDTTSGSSGSCSYLQITIVEPGVDPKILRFKIEAAKYAPFFLCIWLIILQGSSVI